MAKIKKGPGVFVYDGSAETETHTPTPMLSRANSPVFTDDGLPVVDSSGRQVFERAGRVIKNGDGTVRMGGKPKVERIKLDTFVLWGVAFPKGKEVLVEKETLAHKLRCLHCFKEVDGDKVEIKEDADLTTVDGLLSLSKKELLEMAAKAEIVVEPTANKTEIAEAILAGKK